MDGSKSARTSPKAFAAANACTPTKSDALINTLSPEPSFFAEKLYEAMLSEKASYFADITLITSDSKHIPAASMHLSISSPYFENLLNSELAETNPSDISVDIPSAYLHQLLEFIYTDDCRMIGSVRKCAKESTIIPCTLIRDLIILGCVADKTCVRRLWTRCDIALTMSMRRYPYIASFILEAFFRDKTEWGRNMWDAAMEKVASCMGSALLGSFEGCKFKCGLMHLGESTTEAVFFELLRRRKSDHVTHHIIFEALVIWASGGTAFPEEAKEEMWWDHYSVEAANAKMVDKRLPIAKRIAAWFDITRFEARFLSGVVEPSGLVDPALIWHAYKNLSLQYEKNRSGLDGHTHFYYHA